LYHPVLPITGLGLTKTRALVILITELAAGESDDIERKMVSNTVDVMRELLGVGVGLVLRFRLYGVSTQSLRDAPTADRNDVHIQIALSALFLAPFCDFRMSSWDEAKPLGCIRSVC
jgi:hypothetical protein